MKQWMSLVLLAPICLIGCSSEGAWRQSIVDGAKEISHGPPFPHHEGGKGSSTGKHLFYRGHLLVNYEDFYADGQDNSEIDRFLWDVFREYGAFVYKKIDFDSIPDLIAKGGSNTYTPNSARYDYAFVSKDVSVIYSAEWFRGGPKEPEHPNPEVQVHYHVRIN